MTQAEIDIVMARIDQPVGRLDMQFQFGIGCGEVPEPRHQPTAGQRSGGTDLERAAPARIAERCPGAVDALEAVEQGLQQAAAGPGQLHGAILPFEQFLAQAFLQQLDLLADGAWRHMQRLGSRLHAAQAAGFGKGAQRQERKRRGHADTLVWLNRDGKELVCTTRTSVLSSV